MSFIGRFQQSIMRIVPWFLRGPNEARFLEAIGYFYDVAFETLGQGLRLSDPLRCDASALPTISRDRGIRIYPTEPLTSQRARLANWWWIRKRWGSHLGELLNLQPYFLSGSVPERLPRIHIVHEDGNGDSATWHTLDPDGTYRVTVASPSNFDFDQQGQNAAVLLAPAWVAGTAYAVGDLRSNDTKKLYRVTVAGTSAVSGGPTGVGEAINDNTVTWTFVAPWSRFWVVIEMWSMGITSTAVTWDDGSIWDDDGVYWDGVFTANGLLHDTNWRDIVAAINEAKAAHSVLWAVILSFDSSILLPTGTPGAAGQPDGDWGWITNPATGVPTRPNGSSFIYDISQTPP